MSDLPKRRLLSQAEHSQLAAAAARVFAAEPSVIAAYLYGSAARGEPARDLDVAVLFDAKVDPRVLEPLAAALQAAGAPSGPEIDLRPLNHAAPRFQVTVLKEGKLLFERDREARLAHEAHFMSLWADFRPTWLAMRQRMLQRWSHG